MYSSCQWLHSRWETFEVRFYSFLALLHYSYLWNFIFFCDHIAHRACFGAARYCESWLKKKVCASLFLPVKFYIFLDLTTDFVNLDGFYWSSPVKTGTVYIYMLWVYRKILAQKMRCSQYVPGNSQDKFFWNQLKIKLIRNTLSSIISKLSIELKPTLLTLSSCQLR